MIKINSVIGQNPGVQNKASEKAGGSNHEAKAHEGDVVTISADGKKKHILGQLMANISEGAGKKPY